MRNNIIKVVFVVAFTMIAGYGVYIAQNVTKLSDLALDNVEALASSGEKEGDCSDCVKSVGSICHLWSWGGCLGDRK